MALDTVDKPDQPVGRPFDSIHVEVLREVRPTIDSFCIVISIKIHLFGMGSDYSIL
jgi:hypothetical protein